ncbi:YSIRK-type signal peptide-containing protein, partial [Streptococcus sp. 4886]|uniref:YSIRK-type signal peptide-containing protein n=1 Tax=Streptococcus sp. 4886 TaxID=2582682 RepID=UPI001566C4AE
MFYKGSEDREKRLRFSIRKVSFGAASVAVAALFMFPGNGTVSATEQGVTPTNEGRQDSPLKDPDVQNGTYGATPVVSQLDGNSGGSETTAPKDQEETTTPTSTDASASSVESPTVSKEKEETSTTATPAPVASSTASATEGKSAEKNTEVPSTEANSVENKDQTRATVEEESTRPVETTKPAATTESKKSKSRKKRDISATPDADAAKDDPSAHQTYTAPSADASVEELVKALKNLPDKIENNEKIQNMNEVGASTGIAVGEVREIHDFAGWTAVDANGEAGKFAIARKTDEGVFPIETINVLGSNVVWTIEQSFDRTNDYMLFLSKVRTKANSDEESVDNTPYKPSGEGGPRGSKVAKGTKGFRGIEKVFKAYSSKDGSKVQVAFKTGYTGDIDGTKARYKVEVFTDEDGFKTPIYSTSFSPQTPAKDSDKTVIAANDGTTKNRTINIGTGTKKDAETILSKAGNRPNGTGGSFTSREIDLPTGVTSYKVRISSENDLELGMSYQSRFLQYALPVTGLNFNITQDTKQIAKSLLQQAYDRLLDQQNSDENRKTPETIRSYQEKLDKIKGLLDSGDLKSRADYLAALEGAIETRDDLKTQAPSAPVPAVVDTADHVGVEIPAPEHADKVVVTFDKADGTGKDTVVITKNPADNQWSADKAVAG